MSDATPSPAPRPAAAAEVSLPVTYVNLFGASGGPDDMVLDFGFNSHAAVNGAAEPVRWFFRAALNHENIRELCSLLLGVLRHQEQARARRAQGPPPSPPSS